MIEGTPMPPGSSMVTRVPAWIGGSPCAGKSTVAAVIAAARGAAVYSCDEAFERHTDAGPTFARVRAMSVGDRLSRPIAAQVSDVFALYREQWPLIVGDLAGAGLVAEGAALLPSLLASEGVPPDRAVWLVPTEEFQRRHYRQRAWARELVAPLPDPADAFDRWMRRDAAFARIVQAEARDLGYRVVTVDGSVTARDLADRLLGSLWPPRSDRH
jgi:hypothetical protein